ncbi:hypothetical protein ACHAWT_009051 [Skeletonema menzelii]|mmetsp:Transcript_4629/g.7554  ORF Transcript_4629/g.7554 Transcript_4629/m.7554 type:complete len:326 (+) Transcript_4629:94-1071(+)
MKFITSLISITALAGSAAASKQTTVTILEFGKGGTIHAATNSIHNAASITTTPAAMTSFWKAMHPAKDGKYSSHGYAGMAVVPDLFTKADLGVIVGLGGNVAAHLENNMPTAMALLSDSKEDAVVGQVKISGHVSNQLIQGVVSTPKAKSAAVVTDKDDFGRRLSSSTTAGEAGSLDVMSLQIMDDADAKEADDQLRQLIQRLKDESEASGKTVVVHLVVETVIPESVVSSSRRRLQDEDQEGNQNNQQNQNQNNNQNQQQDGENGYTTYAYNYKTMYEIQTFNVITWTAVGLVVIVFMVMGAFIGMPLYPDTLLFGFSSKIGSD